MRISSGSGRRHVRAGRIGIIAAALVTGAGLAGAGYGAWVLYASRPVLSGNVVLAGLSAPVSIVRDAAGVPAITARNRYDLARSLGFLHGQERFFEMDLMRRSGAGELSELVGKAALPLDLRHRLHRFRLHAGRVLARQDPETRAVLDAYTAGVNAGLSALHHAPFEYAILRATPRPWTDIDSLLVVYAMYFDLQSDDGAAQKLRAALTDRLGPAMTAFLDPEQTPLDAPADGSASEAPVMPVSLPPHEGSRMPADVRAPEAERGSNNFAVAGKLTATGSAMVANDMHLSLSVPNIWYRARQIVRSSETAAPALDLTGVTLPGEPVQIVGSNTRVAWAFTDGYIESGDLIRLDQLPAAAPGAPWRYQTPDGPRDIEVVTEQHCPARDVCAPQRIEQTIWGPVTGHDASGAPLVWRWSAEDDNAVDMRGMLALEAAKDVRAALDAAHVAALPHENMLAGDSAGHIGWTIIGPVPRRVGLDDRMPHSWADGQHGWNGWLAPGDVPEIIDPPSGRLWTANGRVVGGEDLTALGDGGYADGMRAGQIRDDLFARTLFSEQDFLAIQLDDHAVALRGWQALLLKALDGKMVFSAWTPIVAQWGERAVPESVGYRLVHDYRLRAIETVFGAWASGLKLPDSHGLHAPPRSTWAVETLLEKRPPGLVPPSFADWDATDAEILKKVADDVTAAGGLTRFTWGAVNHVGIHHPLARAVPLLGYLTDPADEAEAGDTVVPRVQVSGFGASERLVVSPGHEETGLFEMPMGQAANPVLPYYGHGHGAWVHGKPQSLLPGAAAFRLQLLPE
ncbi:penicillin acylase family protein [Acetobacter musti]|uniref:Penicillin acylase family protein n=1 Tax=Acetobacter musti TaxID=864732 RepID=A0ABX0JRV5_9PROT|nr:penicillin acylase family protein [Acetobacter musti]NHN86027.1 penicillin acylase family protein [Acetobacter musti]